MENNYEYYNGFWIYKYDKKVFGKIRPMYRVEQFDTVIFKNGNLDICHKFCDDFNNAFQGGFKNER